MSDLAYSTIPSDDDEFRRTVDELADQADDVDRLREQITTIYPNAHISIQSELGALAAPLRVYIYRDGGGARDS